MTLHLDALTLAIQHGKRLAHNAHCIAPDRVQATADLLFRYVRATPATFMACDEEFLTLSHDEQHAFLIALSLYYVALRRAQGEPSAAVRVGGAE